MAGKEARKLTKKQRVFVAEYPKDYNATRAAKKAGYSRKTAYQIGHNLLKKVEIAEALENGMNERLRKIGIQPERVLTEMARISFSDIRKIFNEDHSLKQPSEWDDETAAAVAGVEVFEEFFGRGNDRTLIGHTKKLKIFDKTKTLEQLGKHLKLFTEKHEVTGKDGNPIEATVSLLDLVKRANGNASGGGSKALPE